MVFHELQSLINRLASHPCVHPNTRVVLSTRVEHHYHSENGAHLEGPTEIVHDDETLDSITATSGVLTLS